MVRMLARHVIDVAVLKMARKTSMSKPDEPLVRRGSSPPWIAEEQSAYWNRKAEATFHRIK